MTPGLYDQKLSRLEPTTADEISKIIDSLDCNTASGIDRISTKALKCVKNLILIELTECVNKCLERGTFPNNLKVAKVSPIFKSGSKSDPGNYRPISVLPIVSKVFERILYNQLEAFLDAKKIIYSKQYGFRRTSNTLSATIDLITKLKINIDQKNIGLGVFVDLKKAFDTVSHDLLLVKLEALGITGIALKIFKSYLSDRTQIVKIDRYQSQPSSITFGVPQGSILGPLLFLIYINDMKDIGLKGDITLYADDTSLFYFGMSVDQVIMDAQSDLNLLHKWFQLNLLTVNIEKTHYVIFKAKNKMINEYEPLKLNNQILTRSKSEKYLGLLIDEKLTWKPHIERVRNKLSSLTGSLRGAARCLPLNTRYVIYNALVKPHIDYLIEIWGSAANTNLRPIQRAQNKIVKVLFQYKHLTPSYKLYKETKLLSIHQTYVYLTCILIRKILTKDLHTQISFTKKKQFQKMKLRNANNLVLHAPRTDYGKKSLMFDGAKLYNKLPNDIKDSQSLKSFKKLLKYFVVKTVI